MNRGPHRGPAGALAILRTWGLIHLQCALASLGALWRAPAGTALTAAVIGVALALPAAAYLAIEGLLDVSKHFDHTSYVSVFLRVEVDDARGAELARELVSREGVEAVRVITKAQALEEFKAMAEVGFGLDKLGGKNPLPVVLSVTPESQLAQDVESLRLGLSSLPEVEFVQADGEWLLRLEAIAQVGKRALWILTGLLGAGIVLVVGNTLRLSVEARRPEVEVAKLFGASDAFVRRPFLYHGLFYGVFGALIACALLLSAATLLEPALHQLTDVYSGEVAVRPSGKTALLLVLLVLVGGWLGLIGAWLCVGPHLRRMEPR